MNASIEFNNFIVGKSDVICAYVRNIRHYYDDPTSISLKLGYTEEQYDKFMLELDFTYDNGYGGQVLDGKIWFKDGTWADRGEYDGSEWWEYHKCPGIPAFLYPFDTTTVTEEELPFNKADYWDGDETFKQ
jgi:hypothetical protein